MIESFAVLFQEHGVLGIGVVVFAKRMGIPVPAIPFLLLAGARGAQDGMFAVCAAMAALVASVSADTAWYFAGRRFGRSMLSLLCRISLSPVACIRYSELAFAQRGATAVLIAKFIPGVAGLAPPLAGALGMRSATFMLLNVAGTVLWIASGMLVGLLLHQQILHVLALSNRLGAVAMPLLIIGALGYFAWLLLRHRFMRRRALPTPGRNCPQLPDGILPTDPNAPMPARRIDPVRRS